ncbi:MAG: DUF429 domain-containing protein [Chloroflexaceae bacterium]|jgi:predicted RNase H-like nuclease|nr:DUF429 domain-containing protein [Chloroflexaceae bacterium]
MSVFIGLDLAWSARNRSGAAVIRGDGCGGRLAHVALLSDDESILGYVLRHAGDGPAIVTVDAPLWVPNATGRRPAEAEIAQAFGRYQAGAHPANRGLLARHGVVRGEALVQALAAHGFSHASAIAAGATGRLVTEVFPHPAMVAIFGLARTLKYKAKPNRSAAERLAAWQTYQRHMAGLAQADPPLHGLDSLLVQDVATMNGRQLKDYEDQMDAVFCAYIGLYALRWGTSRCRTFGTMEEGYIFTPVPKEWWV